VINRLRAASGVRSVSYVSSPPLVSPQSGVERLENVDNPTMVPRAADAVLITSGYFHTAGTRILVGRDISSQLDTGASHEIVLNEQAAKELFPGQNPVQKTVAVLVPSQFGLRSRRYTATIVGLAENMRSEGYASSPRPTFFENGRTYMDGMPNLIVWGDEPIPALERAARKIVTEQMPGMEVRQVFSMEEEAKQSLAPERNRALAALTCALSMAAVTYIGVYSSLAFYLRTKRREMAVRLSLGASVWTIRGMVFAVALRCALVAAVLSFPMWTALRRLSSSDLLGAVSWSPGRAFVITLACVLATVLLAWIPAAAAASLSPAGILKEQ
jgi:ABC-type lipoprotein release transport system permease subunit